MGDSSPAGGEDDADHLSRYVISQRNSIRIMRKRLRPDSPSVEELRLLVPGFVANANQQFRDIFAKHKARHEVELDHVNTELKGMFQGIKDARSWAVELLAQLRRRDRHLAARADELSRDGRMKEARANRLLVALRRVESERTTILRRIAHPQWEVPHHFHMTAVEHFRGNTQAHLMDIAQALSGQLRVCAIAKRTRVANTQLFNMFQTVKDDRDALLELLSSVQKERTSIRELSDSLQSFLDFMKQSMGADIAKHVDRLDREYRHARRQATRDAAQKAKAGPGSGPAGSAGHPSAAKQQQAEMSYRRMKMGYFRRLNVGSKIEFLDQHMPSSASAASAAAAAPEDAPSAASAAAAAAAGDDSADGAPGSVSEPVEIVHDAQQASSVGSDGPAAGFSAIGGTGVSPTTAIQVLPASLGLNLPPPALEYEALAETYQKKWSQLQDTAGSARTHSAKRSRVREEMHKVSAWQQALTNDLDELSATLGDLERVEREADAAASSPALAALENRADAAAAAGAGVAATANQQAGEHASNAFDGKDAAEPGVAPSVGGSASVASAAGAGP